MEMLRKQALNNVTFTVPKNRKPKFDLTLNIIDLNNIPLVCGAAYVKWHLPSSSAAEHRGKTDKSHITDHKAAWDYSKELSVRLTIDKLQYLQECEIHFDVVQEYHEGGRGGRVTLGSVLLNLAEYTQVADLPGDKDEYEDGVVTRRYLMQDSKINATLKIGIRMKQTEGDTTFVPPPLKSAMVIGGIAGIMNAETGDSEDIPNITAKTRELSEAQDAYRRTLAATWACWAGELPPDRLIEDLFAGGDGGRMEPPQATRRSGPSVTTTVSRQGVESDFSDGDSKRTITPQHLSPDTARTGHSHHPQHHHHHHHHHHKNGRNGNNSGSQSSLVSGVSGRGSIEQSMKMSQSGRKNNKDDLQEITEFDLRDDLRSWQVRVN